MNRFIYNILFTGMFLTSAVLFSCSEEEDEPAVLKAKFYYSGAHRSVPAEVTFNNKSVLATSYQWEFGDGETSGDENPVHTYEKKGTYEVVLTAYNDAGESRFYKEEIEMLGNVIGLDIESISFKSDFISDLEDTTAGYSISILDESGDEVGYTSYVMRDFSYGDEESRGTKIIDESGLDLNGAYTLKFYRHDDNDDFNGTFTGDQIDFSVSDIMPEVGSSYPHEYSIDNGNIKIELDWIDE